MTPRHKAEAISPRKAAELLDVSETTIIRLIKAQKLKAIRVGRQWRIKLADVQKGTATN